MTVDETGPEPRRESMILKIVILGFLMIVLLIPLSMIGSIVYERQQRARQVYAEVAAGWGSAQTVGPLLLKALIAQDMFLAGTIVLLLGVMTVIGTLVSDILLVWIDPRIRLEET